MSEDDLDMVIAGENADADRRDRLATETKGLAEKFCKTGGPSGGGDGPRWNPYEVKVVAKAYLASLVELAALRRERDDLELMLRAMSGGALRRVPEDYGPWRFNEMRLRDDGTGLPKLDDAARAALKEKA